MVTSHWLDRWLQRQGESFTLSGQTYRGVFEPAPGSLLYFFYATTELDALTRPLVALYTKPDVSLTESGTITWRGTTWVVLKKHEIRHGDTSVYQAAILQKQVIAA